MSLSQFRLDGKTALITGANRGIGLAIAQLFLKAGAHCMLTSRSQTSALNALLEGNTQKARWISADVTDVQTPDKIVAETLNAFGALDILVNNAGIADNGDFHNFSDSQLESILATNFTAPFRIAREAIKPMLSQGSGSIVNMGSISGFVANKPQLQVAYNSSKAAIHQMTTTMAFEYASRGIRVNALAPGYIVSDMTAGGIENAEWNKIWTENTPMQRFGKPSEMANCALFLASDAASYVNGATLVADGGYLTH